MSFKTSQFYMHKNAQDACIEVLGVSKDGQVYTLNVAFWNLGYTGKPWRIDEQTFSVHSSVAKDWIKLDYDDLVVPRQAPGLPYKYRDQL